MVLLELGGLEPDGLLAGHDGERMRVDSPRALECLVRDALQDTTQEADAQGE